MTTSIDCAVVERCGGCPHWGATPDTRAARLREAVSQAMRRPVTDVVLSDSPVGWRHRLKLRPDASGRLGLSGGRSHDVVALPGCPVAHPLLDRALRSLPPMPGPAEVELRTDGQRVVCLITTRARHGRGRRGKAPARDVLASIPEDTVQAVLIDGKAWRGRGALDLPAGLHTLRVSPGSFFQAHLAVNDLLREHLASIIDRLAPTALLDLYAGVGNLGLLLGPSDLPRTLIESNRAAVEDARHNAAQLGRTADVRKGDAHRFQAGDAFFDVAVLDPPRRGAPGVLEQLALTRPRAIVYVSCDPRSLSRDLHPVLSGGRYDIASLRVFEMFPLSRHAETVCVLTPDGTLPGGGAEA